LFKFLVDDLLYAQRLPMKMGQFARAFQPGLPRPSTSLRELFFNCLRHVLAQGNPQCTGGGLGLAEGGIRDLQRGLHNGSIAYLWGSRLAAVGGIDTESEMRPIKPFDWTRREGGTTVKV